ncbi:MAG: dephospho-CoA kinase [Flavobacteriales bacterium]
MNISSNENNNTPILIGLTGGIGSGKSTVAKIFQSFGIKVYNSDVEAKKIINTDIDVINKIKQVFGENIYVDDVLDSKQVAQKVFNNKDLLNKLNAIVHPKVKSDFENWVKNNANENILLKEAAILIESGANKGLDKMILVTAPEELRVKRVCERDYSNVEDVRKRIKAQMSDNEKMKFVDYVIKNNEEELLLPQVVKIIEEL